MSDKCIVQNGKTKYSVYTAKKVDSMIGGSGSGSSSPLMPSGSVTQFAGASLPEGWLECDGSAISRTTYSDLFSTIGETYGAGDGSTTFNLPNLKGKVPVGLDSGDADFDSLGKTGGEKTHQLTVDEMPSHIHRLRGDNDSGPDGGDAIATDDIPDTLLETGVCDPAGGDQPHNNLQPYIVMKYIIKY